MEMYRYETYFHTLICKARADRLMVFSQNMEANGEISYD